MKKSSYIILQKSLTIMSFDGIFSLVGGTATLTLPAYSVTILTFSLK